VESVTFFAFRKNGKLYICGRRDTMAASNEKANVAAAFIIGAMLGAGVALLFAPQSGRKTRRNLRVLGAKAKSKAEAALIDLRRPLDNLVDDVSRRIETEIERGKEWTESKIADVQRAVEAGKKHIQDEIERIAGA
jgi:gas vesicle protein